MSQPAKTHVTAAILVIGDEILSGRTKDKNIGFICEFLTQIGIEAREVRVVPDSMDEIVAALNALRGRYTYVFTTGGIGPTHDDITADAIACAFGAKIGPDERAVAMLRERFAEAELNEARLRMARIPQGAELIANRISKAPGFQIGNVIVMAGVPAIMQAMLEEVSPRLKTGAKIISETIRANAKEGDIATELRDIAKAHPDAMVGSYPFWDEDGKPNTNIIIRSREPETIAPVREAVAALLARLHG